MSFSLLPALAQAQANAYWGNDVDGQWNVGSNWSGGTVPNAPDTADISRNGHARINGYTSQAMAVYIGNNGIGSVTVDGLNSGLEVSGILVGYGGDGTLTLSNGGTLIVNNELSIGGFGGGVGRVTIDGSDSRLDTKSTYFGQSGAGTLTLSNGGTFSNTAASNRIIVMGTAPGGPSTLNIGTGAGWGTFDAEGVTVGNGIVTVNFNHNALSNSPYYFTNDSMSTGTPVALTKTGTGTLTVVNTAGYTALRGTNTYNGGTTVTGGFINFAAADNFGTGNITLNGGGLQWATGTTTDISSRLNPLGANGGAFDTNGNDVTLATPITGTGNTSRLTKTGTGTLTLTGVNTYGGGTTVSEGTLAGNIPTGGDLTLAASGAKYDGTGAARSVGALDGVAGSLLVNTLGLTVQSGTFGGVIDATNTGGLTKTGSGTLTLSGAANSYTGLTEVRGGTLALQNSATISNRLALFQSAGGTTFNAGSWAGTLAQLDVHGNASNAAPVSFTGDLNVSGGTMTFHVPSSMSSGGTMLAVSGNANVSGARVNLQADGGAPTLSPGDYIVLIGAGGTLSGTTNSISASIMKQ